ncbi:putative MATE family efflux protein [Paenibacillus cellulosilyticus]|uniref:Probable multidrug resistance protein NorM n=1 Tax=Paenibacillus cellulosilyticus TaxID=375489 RepID=A0A2V2YP33_9BACL|nr:MATE family efflux transporter [Paenibacillus cellulosilyticus]PWV97864.1 putative MATE family efflux protein [Paenibacillus cellulosilyticus]QKS46965.1 MATE family efflux transporter [Paenibacillus cellulosilyticus]
MLRSWTTILALAIPSLVAFAGQTMTGTLNLIIVGKLGFLFIAIVGVVNIIMYNAFAIFSGIGHTVNYLVAQNDGAGNMRKGIERTYFAFYLCALFAVFLIAVGWLFADDLLRLTGGSAELVEAGSFYTELRFYAMAFGIFNFAFHGFLRGIGATRMSMVISIIANAIMLLGTYTLTYGHWGMPDLGLKGAGLAILLGEGIQALVCAFVFWFPLNRKYKTRVPARLDWREMRLIAAESGKLGVQEFSLSLAMYLFTAFVARLGDQALAANEVALSIMSFGFMPAFAFGSTATILVGRHVGQGEPKLGRRAGTDVAILGTLFLIALGTLELIFAMPIAHIYTSDPDVYKLAAHLISVSAYLQIFDGLLNVYAGCMRGLGETTFLLRISVICSWVIFVPLAYLFLFVFDWGSMGAWLALYLYLTVFGIGVMIRFYRTDWSLIRVKEAAGH